MKVPRPSKKVIWIFVACLLIVGGVFAFLEYRNRQAAYTEKSLETLIAIQNKTMETDLDKDGLKDWEETLWKADPKNPDTDGDLTPDGEEVGIGRDPSVPGPNDNLDQQTIEKNQAQTNLINNDTARFSRAFLTKYLMLKQSGEDQTDINNYQEVIDLFLEETEKTDNLKVYDTTNIKVVSETPDSIRVYGNALGTLLILYSPPTFENELIVFNRAVETENDEELEKLDANIAEYQRIRDGLLAMAVPQTFVAGHINLLNVVEALAIGVQAMRNSAEDPLHSIAGIERYPAATDSFIPSLQTIAINLDSSGVVFAQGEAGQRFLSVIINPQIIPAQ